VASRAPDESERFVLKTAFPILKRSALVFLILCSILPNMKADHVPNSQMATGSEDSMLAGVDVNKDPIERILKSFGKPASIREDTPATEGVHGTRTYLWKKPHVIVTLGTFFSDKPDLPDVPFYVSVYGTDGSLGRTGRGLKLGDAYGDILHHYGNHFRKQGSTVMIEWKTGTTLQIQWNKSGVINRLDLTGHNGFASP
jgi:hypothetical protein